MSTTTVPEWDTADRMRKSLREADLGVQEMADYLGVRRIEIARLQLGDYDRRHQTLHDITGKGGHQRAVPVPSEAVEWLDPWVNSVGSTTGPFIRSHPRPAQGLSAHQIGMLVTRWMWDAGIKHRAHDGVSLHACRHTAGSDVYERCRNLGVVASFLGHANESTAQRYTRRVRLDELRPAVEGRDYGHAA